MNIPKLRFKGFNDEWCNKKFDDLIDIKSNTYNPIKSNINYRCIELEHINQNSGTINGFINSNKQKSNKFFFKKGEVLFSKLRPYLRKYWLAEFDGVCSSEIWVAKSKNDKLINNKFIFDIFQSKYFLQLCNLSTGSKMPRADWTFIKEQSIPIPLLNEQLKIANFLNLLDKKIELQTKKIEALKLFKLSIKKKIFQTNINTEIKLNQLVKCESSSLTLSDIQNIDGPFPVYGAEGFIKNINFYNHNNEYIAIVKDGAGVGRTMICPSKSSTISTMNALIPILEYKATYILELLNLINFKKYIIGSGIPHIYFKDYGKEKIKIHSIDKSNKITKLFDLLNKRINYTQNHVEHLKKLKQGLLQIMFI